MKSPTQTTAPTFESVWALLQETAQLQRENAQQQKKTDRQMKETDRQMKETDRRMRQSRADFNRRMKKFEETMGSWSNNHGSFAEEHFYNSFEVGQRTFFSEQFDGIEKHVKGFTRGFRDEYDILLHNGKSVGIVEVKFKAHKDHIPKVLRKAETFRENFPNFAHHQIYLGLASLAFYPELEQECIDQGIAVVKQVGDAVIINDGHLRVF